MDPCLYFRQQQHEFIMGIIWLDEFLVFSNNTNVISDINDYLGKHFSRSTPAVHFVGLSITKDRKQKNIYGNQPEYTRKILECFHMSESRRQENACRSRVLNSERSQTDKQV